MIFVLLSIFFFLISFQFINGVNHFIALLVYLNSLIFKIYFFMNSTNSTSMKLQNHIYQRNDTSRRMFHSTILSKYWFSFVLEFHLKNIKFIHGFFIGFSVRHTNNKLKNVSCRFLFFLIKFFPFKYWVWV